MERIDSQKQKLLFLDQRKQREKLLSEDFEDTCYKKPAHEVYLNSRYQMKEIIYKQLLQQNQPFFGGFGMPIGIGGLQMKANDSGIKNIYENIPFFESMCFSYIFTNTIIGQFDIINFRNLLNELLIFNNSILNEHITIFFGFIGKLKGFRDHCVENYFFEKKPQNRNKWTEQEQAAYAQQQLENQNRYIQGCFQIVEDLVNNTPKLLNKQDGEQLIKTIEEIHSDIYPQEYQNSSIQDHFEEQDVGLQYQCQTRLVYYSYKFLILILIKTRNKLQETYHILMKACVYLTTRKWQENPQLLQNLKYNQFFNNFVDMFSQQSSDFSYAESKIGEFQQTDNINYNCLIQKKNNEANTKNFQVKSFKELIMYFELFALTLNQNIIIVEETREGQGKIHNLNYINPSQNKINSLCFRLEDFDDVKQFQFRIVLPYQSSQYFQFYNQQAVNEHLKKMLKSQAQKPYLNEENFQLEMRKIKPPIEEKYCQEYENQVVIKAQYFKQERQKFESQQVQIVRFSQIKIADDYQPETILKHEQEKIQKGLPQQTLIDLQKIIQKKVQFIKCPICTAEDIPQEEALTIKGCNHQFCQECLKQQLNTVWKTKKQNIQDINDLKCPGTQRNGQGCPMPFSVEHLQVLWTKAQFDEFQTYLVQRKNGIQCQNLDCRKTFQYQKSDSLNCHHCRLAHCYQCRGLKQQDHNCAQKIEILFETLSSMQKFDQNIKVRFCPNQDCIKSGPNYYLKDDYCEHVTCQICLEDFNFCCSSTRQPSFYHDMSFHRSECPLNKYTVDLNKFDYVKETPEQEKYQPNKCSECKKAGKSCSRPISYTEFLNKILVEEKFSKADILQIDPELEEKKRKEAEYNQQNEQLGKILEKQ